MHGLKKAELFPLQPPAGCYTLAREALQYCFALIFEASAPSAAAD